MDEKFYVVYKKEFSDNKPGFKNLE